MRCQIHTLPALPLSLADQAFGFSNYIVPIVQVTVRGITCKLNHNDLK
jgi:hypothetical protein